MDRKPWSIVVAAVVIIVSVSATRGSATEAVFSKNEPAHQEQLVRVDKDGRVTWISRDKDAVARALIDALATAQARAAQDEHVAKQYAYELERSSQTIAGLRAATGEKTALSHAAAAQKALGICRDSNRKYSDAIDSLEAQAAVCLYRASDLETRLKKAIDALKRRP